MHSRIFDIAWRNAIPVQGRDPNQYRLCYICKGIMHHGNKWNPEFNPTGGVNVDHVNGDRSDNRESNLVAVHYSCNVQKGQSDYTYYLINARSRTWWL